MPDFEPLHRRPLDRVATPGLDVLLESGPAVLYRIALRARAVDYVSPNVVDVLGLTADMVTRDPAALMARIHPDDLARVRRGQLSVRRGDAGVIEYRIRDLRGRWMWVRDHLTLVRDGAGEPQHIVGVVVDVTENRSFALTLRREHSALAQLLEMMPVGVVVVDARTRRILIGQRAVASLVGERRTDLFAQDLERYGGYWPGTDTELGLLDWPLNRTLRTGESLHDVNADVRRADGSRVTVSMSTTPVTDPDGTVVAVAMAFLDVTERTAILRRTEQALAAEREARAAAEQARAMVEALQRLSAELAAVTTRPELEAAIMGPVLAAVGAHQTWVGATDGDDVVRILLSNVEGFAAEARLPLDTPVPGCEVVRTGVPLWIASGRDAARRWPALRAFVDAHDDAIAALPLRQGGEVFGCLVLRWTAPFAIDAALRTLLMALAEVAAQAVKRVQLLEHERAVARALQDSMMLQRLPVLDGVDVAAVYQPASGDLEVGGDWYDVLALPDGRIGVAVGDVMGRGLRAATAMGQLRSALAALAGSFDDPATVLERLDRFADRVDGAWLASVFYGVIDPAARTIRYASAGHVPPLVADEAGVRALTDGRSGLLGGPDPAPAGQRRARAGPGQPAADVHRRADRDPRVGHRGRLRAPGRPGGPAAGRGGRPVPDPGPAVRDAGRRCPGGLRRRRAAGGTAGDGRARPQLPRVGGRRGRAQGAAGAAAAVAGRAGSGRRRAVRRAAGRGRGVRQLRRARLRRRRRPGRAGRRRAPRHARADHQRPRRVGRPAVGGPARPGAAAHALAGRPGGRARDRVRHCRVAGQAPALGLRRLTPRAIGDAARPVARYSRVLRATARGDPPPGGERFRLRSSRQGKRAEDRSADLVKKALHTK